MENNKPGLAIFPPPSFFSGKYIVTKEDDTFVNLPGADSSKTVREME